MQPFYDLPDGRRDDDRARRVSLAGDVDSVVSSVWDHVFDGTVRA